MSGDYEVGSLTVANVARAYAVIQHLFSEVSFQQWQAATDTDRKRRDWLTVTDTAGAVRGLCYMFVTGHPLSLQMEVPVLLPSVCSTRGTLRECCLMEPGKSPGIEMQAHSFLACWTQRLVYCHEPQQAAPTVGLVYDLQTADEGVPSNNAAKT